ncbi:MAG: helix-turn-helix domain-containing protein [Gammaproteobacteria bacterium]|nr:helix-turn-helix domain-containing protein [Gammaproteobacteria bacterium]
MSQQFFSVEQVAERLNLHVRTVRGYVRDGRLKAVRIGKQYRIAREDLEAFTGQPAGPSAREAAPRARHVDVSSVVQIDAIGPDEASRIANGLIGAANGRGQHDDALRVDAVYDEERGRLKVILTGGLAPVVSLLQLVDLYQQQR